MSKYKAVQSCYKFLADSVPYMVYTARDKSYWVNFVRKSGNVGLYVA